MTGSYKVKPDQREVVLEGQDSPIPHPHPGTPGTDWVMVSLLLMCILVRVITWMVCVPTNQHADTEEYAALAYRFMTHDFRNYSADRTPVYSFLLLAAKLDYRVVWFIQNILGTATSLLLYAMAKDRTRKRGLAFLAGASNSIFLNQLMFEPFLMTETLAAFFLVLSLFLSLRFCRNCDLGRGGSHTLLLHLGVILGLAALLRPLFLYLPIVLAPMSGLNRLKRNCAYGRGFPLLQESRFRLCCWSWAGPPSIMLRQATLASRLWAATA